MANRKPLTEEVKRKISEAQKGVPRGPMKEETKRKISESMKGRVVSDYMKQRASETHKGKVLSEETKRKIAEAHKVKIKIKNTITGEEIIYNSMQEAERANNIPHCYTSYTLKHQNGRYKHFIISRI